MFIKTKSLEKQYVSPVLKFSLRFILWFLLLQSLVWFIKETPLLITLSLNAISWLTFQLYTLFGYQAQLIDNLIVHLDNGRFLLIDQSCSGFQMSATLVAGLLASHCKKIHYYLLAILLVQFLNQLRLTHLFYLIHDDMMNFKFYHLYVWQTTNFLLSCIFFYAIMFRESKND